MNIQLAEIDRDNPHLSDLFVDYVAEMVRYLDPNDPNTRSVDASQILAKYWQEQPVWAYFILADEEIAGFCLLRHYPGEVMTMDIAQYYILPAFRRQGLGAHSLVKLIEMHPGKWLIRVLKTNTGAFDFWIDAVKRSVQAEYECRDESELQHYIRFETASESKCSE